MVRVVMMAISLLGVGRDYDALALIAPFVCAEVVRHVQTGKEACGAEVGVHGEEVFA